MSDGLLSNIKFVRIMAKLIVTIALIVGTVVAYAKGAGEIATGLFGTMSTAVGFWFRDERNRQEEK